MCIWRCEHARLCVDFFFLFFFSSSALYKFVHSFNIHGLTYPSLINLMVSVDVKHHDCLLAHHSYVLYQRHYTTTYNTTATTTTATATIPTIATTNATIAIVSEARAAGLSITTSPLVANVHTNLFPTSPKWQRPDIWQSTQGAARYSTEYYHRTEPRLSFFVAQTARQVRSTVVRLACGKTASDCLRALQFSSWP